MLKNEWKDAAFSIAAIGDRQAVAESDDLVVIAAIDPQGMPITLQEIPPHGGSCYCTC